MNWIRLISGLPADPRLAVAAKKAAVPRACMLSIWFVLIDMAIKSRPRGVLPERIDAEEIAVLLDVDAKDVERALEVLFARQMILPTRRLSGWDKLQGLSTPRVKALRSRRAAADRQEKKRQSERLPEPLPPVPAGSPAPPTARARMPLSVADQDDPHIAQARRARLQQEVLKRNGFHKNTADIPPSAAIRAHLERMQKDQV
jgi:hypothetical protein